MAGPAFAYWLHRTGHEPTLIERAPRFRTGGYVVDFCGVWYDVAEKMCIREAVHYAGYQVESVRSFCADCLIAANLGVDAFRRVTQGRFTSVPRGDLAAAIYAAIESRVETIFGDSICMVNEHSDGVCLTFESGRAREFYLVVGADGLHSNVRSLVFWPESQFDLYLGCMVAAWVVDCYRPRDELVYVTHSLPVGPWDCLPCAGTARCFCSCSVPNIHTRSVMRRLARRDCGESSPTWAVRSGKQR